MIFNEQKNLRTCQIWQAYLPIITQVFWILTIGLNYLKGVSKPVFKCFVYGVFYDVVIIFNLIQFVNIP